MGFKPDFRSKNEDMPKNFNSLPERERDRLMQERIRLLHIHGQYIWHSECRIVGNRNALIVLRDAIDEALREGQAETSAMVTDGEGYCVQIKLCDAAWESDKWRREPLPYTANYAKGR